MGPKLVIFMLIFCTYPSLGGKSFLSHLGVLTSYYHVELPDSKPLKSGGHIKEKEHGHEEGHAQGKHHEHKKEVVGRDYEQTRDYELTPSDRCRELKALCKGRHTCLEALNTHSQMQISLPIFLWRVP